MRYIKVVSLLAVAVAAFTAFAASASATTVTSPTGTVYTGKISATSTDAVLHGSFVSVTCPHSHVEAQIEEHGKGKTVKGKVLTMTFGPEGKCNYPVTVVSLGTLELHAVNSKGETCTEAAGDTCTGTLTATGQKVSIATSVGTCVFTTNATDVGTVTPTGHTSGKAVLDVHGTIPRTEGNFLCGSTGTWTGNYTVNTPSTLWIDEN